MEDWQRHKLRMKDLTPRELQIMELVAAGKSNPDIETILGIKWRTAKNHIHRMLAKLDLTTRAQLAYVWGRQQGAEQLAEQPKAE